MPGKRIALFLDGTWNTVKSNTNVWRMKSLCINTADQITYYSAGVGTLFGQRLIGGMFGYGLDQEVIQAYMWLMAQYDEGDRIFIFGFSRGAFTARSLAGLISKCGLLKSGSPVSITQLYDRYKKGTSPHTIRELAHVKASDLKPEDHLIAKYSMAVPIWFQGVWDTVGALGVPFGEIPFISRSNYGFLETDLRINDTRAFHALAIDEHRPDFTPTLWTRSVKKGAGPSDTYPPRPLDQVEQRWFVGAHADVGGGYENGMLAQIPLNWLMQKAGSHGLVFKGEMSIDGTEFQSPIHDSFSEMAHGVYKLSKFGVRYFRTVGAGPIEDGDSITTTINETIDASVFERYRNDTSYRPRNIRAWASKAEKSGVSIDSISSSVLADSPGASVS
jgi:uncharacterized protein (DUF2235 family)